MRYTIESQFPSINVKTTRGKFNLFEEYEGKWIVFFAYPSDSTPVCTTEIINFNKRLEDFRRLNTEVIGLSTNDLYQHNNWLNWMRDNLNIDIKIPLIDDSNEEISQRLGLLKSDGELTFRSLIIIDPDRKIKLIIEFPIELERDVNRVFEFLQRLQMFDYAKKKAHLNSTTEVKENEITL